VADDILSNYQQVIETFTFITGSKGAFELRVDGNLLYSKYASGRHANPGEALNLFKEFIAPETPVYPQ
jgi:predicted Rdx family selenoprotein